MIPSQSYHRPAAGAVLGALHELTAQHGYLPEAGLRRVARDLGVPLSQVYSAATFYAAFSFRPPGRHKVQVCEGTACYVRGAAALMARAARSLGIEPDQTTLDSLFTLKRVRCVGSCGLAPVVRIDDQTFGRLAPDELDNVLATFAHPAAEGVRDEA